MEEEVSDVVKISIELSLTAIVLSVIVVFGILSNVAYSDKRVIDSSTAYMNDLGDLYYYNDKIVTASDALELMMTYPMQYDYIFEFCDVNGAVYETRERRREKQMETGDYREYWSESSLRSMIDGYEKDRFNSELVRNVDGQSVGAIKFTYQEG